MKPENPVSDGAVCPDFPVFDFVFIPVREDAHLEYIGQGLLGFTPVEIVGCEVYEAGSPLASDNG